MKRLFAIVVIVFASSTAYAKGAKKNLHRPRGPVTTIDAGGAVQPESPWPEITKKGHL